MTLIVKLGSSIVAADDGELRAEVLDSVCSQVAQLEQDGERVVMVTSGAIARGMRLMELPARPRTMDELQAASAVGQGDLFRAYESRLAAHGTRAAQVLLTAADIAARTNYLNARQTLRRLIEWGVVPVVNENDTTATDEVTFGDNDVLAAQVAILLGASWLLLLTERDGLYAPGANGPELLGDVPAGTSPHDLALADMGASASGRGGIASKVASASMATGGGVTCVIASGTADGVIPAVASGHHVGTRFSPAVRRESAFKLWLRYAKPSLGRVAIDEGAARALRERGTSLLAVGVTACQGMFLAGDAVDVVSESGAPVGKGISAMPADEVRAVAGLKSDQVRARFPEAAPQVIHRDEFVLAEPAGADGAAGARGLMGGR